VIKVVVFDFLFSFHITSDVFKWDLSTYENVTKDCAKCSVLILLYNYAEM